MTEGKRGAAARRAGWRSPGGLALLALVAVVALGFPLWRFYAPVLEARSQFPSLSPDQRRGLIREVAERAPTGFSAFDAAGAEVAVARAALIEVEPGRCAVRHDRWPHPDQTRGRAGLRQVSGRATFTCVFVLQVEGHGPLGAVVRREYLTNPPANWRPSAPRAIGGAEGRALLGRISAGP